MDSDRDVVSPEVVGSPPPSNNSIEQIDRDTAVGSNSNGVETCEYSGWVYHIGVSKFGREYYRLRFLSIRGKYVEIYKRDPYEVSEIKPIRKGVIGPTFMVEEFGRQKNIYMLRFYNRLDEARNGEFGFASAGEFKQWVDAFDRAKRQVVYEFRQGVSVRSELNMEDELNPVTPRRKLQRYGHGLKKLFGIQQDCNGASRSKNTFRGALMPPLWMN